MLKADPVERLYQTDFSANEFQRRREAIYQAIGDNGLAFICGSQKNCDHNIFRQNNDFYYVCGIEVPHAYILLDGREKKTTIFLSHQSKERQEKEGTILSAEIAETCCELTKVFLSLIRPGVTDEEIRLEAAREMAHVVKRTRFSKEIYRQAAERCLDFPYHMSHSVGMAVHDVGHYRGTILKPGIVIALDPQLIIPEEKRYIRVEDTVVVTEDGVENLTVDAPLELDDVEQLMEEEGIFQRYPPLN